MTNYYDEFYPTPKKLIDRMLDGVDWNLVETVLEPSAGKGDIADRVRECLRASKSRWGDYHRSEFQGDIDTIEINPELQYVLKGKNYRVVHDDFLTFNTYKSYHLIVMNPPFSQGAAHLRHALEIQKRGGAIICLLNADTLRKPCTLERVALIQELKELKAEVEYLSREFIGQDVYRKTDVEVALIKVNIPEEVTEPVIVSELRKANVARELESNAGKELTDAEFVNAIVARYNFEAELGVRIIRDFKSEVPYLSTTFNEERKESYLLEISPSNENEYLKTLRSKYWDNLFKSAQFSDKYTSNLLSKVRGDINSLKDYDFTVYNIKQIQIDMTNAIETMMQQTIIDLFDKLSRKHSWYDESSENVHYYNGWKTNKSYLVNEKVIFPMHTWSTWGNRWDFSYSNAMELADIEKTLQYLDGRQSNSAELRAILRKAESEQQSRNIQCKYFSLTFYKKGTCHLKFTDLEILKKFNLFGSQQKGWLPPSYGKKNYSEMTREEQQAIDEFEGEKSYEETLQQAEFYLSGVCPVMLGTGND